MQGERAREEEEQLLQVTAPNNGGKNWKKARVFVGFQKARLAVFPFRGVSKMHGCPELFKIYGFESTVKV